MNKNLYQYNGHAINDTTNYRAFLQEGDILPQTDHVLVERSQNYPESAGKELPGFEFEFVIHIASNVPATIRTKQEELKGWFATDDQDEHQLIFKDGDNGDKQWYRNCTPTALNQNGRVITITMSAADPYWRSVTENTTSAPEHTITTTGQQQTITPTGNSNSYPTIVITPNNAKTGGYGYKRFITARNLLTTALTDYPLEVLGGIDTTGASWVGGGKALASGNDVRVMVDGAEVPRWLQGWNTATSKVWITCTWQPGQTVTLSGNLANTGAVTALNFLKTVANKKALKKFPSSGMIIIDSEIFTYTGVVANKWQLTGCTRATKGTAMAAHTSGTACYWLEHEIYLMYGNSSATAPDQDDAKKPIIDLTSTNTSWIYTSFWERDGQRAAGWQPSILQADSSETHYYTATQDTEADPATDIGATIAAYQKSGVWKPETAQVRWGLHIPCGVTSVASANGNKYRYTANWPTVAGLQKSIDGSSYASITNQATPAAAKTWTAWSIGVTALGATYYYIRLILNGTVNGTASNLASIEMAAITLTLDNTKTPSVTLGAELANYWLDLTLTNINTGDALYIKYLMTLAKTLTIDTENKTVTYDDGQNAAAALDTNTRRMDWLALLPGVGNVIQFDDVGTNNVTCQIKYRDRNN